MRLIDRFRAGLVTVTLVSFALAPLARAQPDNLAKAHYRTGLEYYQRGAYADAIREFKRSFALSKRPELLYNIGQAHERLGNLSAAVEHFERYLPHAGTEREALEQKIRSLKRRLAETGIRVTSPVDGAEISVDGERVGTTPTSDLIPVPPGQHKVTVSKPGYAPYSLAVSVVSGTAVTIDADLQPSTGATTPPSPGDRSDDGPEEPRGRKRLWTWIVWGTAGALLAAGAVTGGIALSKANKAQTPTAEDNARGLALATDILLGAGAAAAVAGTVLFFVEGKGTESSQASVLPAVSPRFVGVHASLRF